MNVKALGRVTTDDTNLETIQDNVERTLAPLLANPFASGQLLESITLTAGTNRIPHKLGRKLTGWVVTRLRGPATPVKIITDPTSYTPSTQGMGASPTVVSFYWSRSGSDLILHGKIISDTPSGSELRIGLPTGLTIASTVAANEPCGAVAPNNATANVNYSVLASGGNTFVTFGVKASAANDLSASVGGTTILQATNTIAISVRVPIEGWAVTDSSFVQVYDAQDGEVLPDKFLKLISSGAASCDLFVF